MSDRIKKFQGQLVQHGLDCYIVTNDANIRYLTHFPASESILIVFASLQKQKSHKPIYLTDSRYIEEARIALNGVKVERFTHSISKSLFGIISDKKVKKVGFDDRHFSVNYFKILKRDCPKGIKLTTVNGLVEAMRELKDKSEVTQIRKCLQLNLAAYRFLKKVIRPGFTERDVLNKLDNFVRFRGAGFSFDPIVASGPNSAFPHARVTSRRIRNHEPVLVDMGIEINGYKSDLTRMFFLGKMTPLYTKVYAAVEEAQKRGIEKITAGATATEVDQQARNYLKSLNLAQFFGHSLGHGVGLDIHEEPRLSPQSRAILKAGMIITVEPGIYLPGKFGVRLEEMVLVKETGCEVISQS